MKKIAVFASGSGSNYQAIMEYLKTAQDEVTNLKQVALEVGLLVCDTKNAPVIAKAASFGTPSLVIERAQYKTKCAFEQTILDALLQADIEFIALAGYMRLFGSTLLHAYQGRIINIHPSLLPAFPGKHAMEQALAYGVRITGITVHYIDEGIDTGPIIYQQPIEIAQGESIESLATKVHGLEHKVYPRIIEACARGQVQLVNSQVVWNQNLCV